MGECVHALSELGAYDVSRRAVLVAAPFVAASLVDPQRRWLLWLLEHDVGDVETAASADGPVGRVQAMSALFDQMDNQYGGGDVRRTVSLFLADEVLPRLRTGGLSAAERGPLFIEAAKLASMAGWCSYDCGEYGLAQRYMVQGLRLCAEGGERVLGGQILAGLSHLATTMGEPEEGALLARAGIATAKRSGSPLGLMRVHAMAARANAAMGRPREAFAALRAAEEALDASRNAADESRFVRFLDAHYLEAESALVFRDLGEVDKAERLALASVMANGERRRRQGISRSVLASAYLARGDLDAALHIADQALDQLSGVRSERAVQALRDFSKRLGPHSKEPSVTAFRKRAVSLRIRSGQ
ncbi:hypothetical protein ACIO6T_39165 [Streptomyces sp. NPDC087532]|uniref:hypothetical protein n=1 Tax=Streptomyces sp. NPDC087532 TaxID=3365795 RepID=UPI003828D4CF